MILEIIIVIIHVIFKALAFNFAAVQYRKR